MRGGRGRAGRGGVEIVINENSVIGAEEELLLLC